MSNEDFGIIKGAWSRYFSSLKKSKMCPHIKERPQIMVYFFYQRLYYFTETIFCRLLLRMAPIEMDCNLKKLS